VLKLQNIKETAIGNYGSFFKYKLRQLYRSIWIYEYLRRYVPNETV